MHPNVVSIRILDAETREKESLVITDKESSRSKDNFELPVSEDSSAHYWQRCHLQEKSDCPLDLPYQPPYLRSCRDPLYFIFPYGLLTPRQRRLLYPSARKSKNKKRKQKGETKKHHSRTGLEDSPEASRERSSLRDIVVIGQAQSSTDPHAADIRNSIRGHPSAIEGSRKARELDSGSLMQFKDVHFSYPSRPEINALDSLTFEIPKGQVVAFVGASGCGKSTVIQLIERFYSTKSGTIFYEGMNRFSTQAIHVSYFHNWSQALSSFSHCSTLFQFRNLEYSLMYDVGGHQDADPTTNAAQNHFPLSLESYAADIEYLPIHKYREEISLVQQLPVLFDGSIESNIRMGSARAMEKRFLSRIGKQRKHRNVADATATPTERNDTISPVGQTSPGAQSVANSERSLDNIDIHGGDGGIQHWEEEAKKSRLTRLFRFFAQQDYVDYRLLEFEKLLTPEDLEGTSDPENPTLPLEPSEESPSESEKSPDARGSSSPSNVEGVGASDTSPSDARKSTGPKQPLRRRSTEEKHVVDMLQSRSEHALATQMEGELGKSDAATYRGEWKDASISEKSEKLSGQPETYVPISSGLETSVIGAIATAPEKEKAIPAVVHFGEREGQITTRDSEGQEIDPSRVPEMVKLVEEREAELAAHTEDSTGLGSPQSALVDARESFEALLEKYTEKVQGVDMDILRAAYNASSLEFILSLPNGFKTRVGVMGGLLSGGQRQRVSIAQALIRRPHLLLLGKLFFLFMSC